MKPGTFTQLYIQLVFAPKNREALFQKHHRIQLCGYIGQTIHNLGCKTIIVNAMPDHVHVFFGLKPDVSVSDLVRDVKRSSALWINQQNWFPGTFAWQDGYGAFSYSRSHINDVYSYIEKQEEHHQKKGFREEYLGLLRKFEIEFDERYLFDFFD